MSDDSLTDKAAPPPKPEAWRSILAVVWPLACFYLLAQAVAILFATVLSGLGLDVAELYKQNSWFRFLFYLILSAAILAATIWPVYRYVFKKQSMRQMLGFKRRPDWTDFGISLLAAFLYFVASILAIRLVSILWSGFDVDQTQDIGETQPNALLDYVFAALTLVVLPPILEETVFRGFMFGGLRQRYGFWFSAILTSLAFGLVHGQVNVGVDVFVLSLFSCYLRERTGNLWASIFLHALKNGVAFMALFLIR